MMVSPIHIKPFIIRLRNCLNGMYSVEIDWNLQIEAPTVSIRPAASNSFRGFFQIPRRLLNLKVELKHDLSPVAVHWTEFPPDPLA